jgi:hypothetical protein
VITEIVGAEWLRFKMLTFCAVLLLFLATFYLGYKLRSYKKQVVPSSSQLPEPMPQGNPSYPERERSPIAEHPTINELEEYARVTDLSARKERLRIECLQARKSGDFARFITMSELESRLND